jgi:hypothetical protein
MNDVSQGWYGSESFIFLQLFTRLRTVRALVFTLSQLFRLKRLTKRDSKLQMLN